MGIATTDLHIIYLKSQQQNNGFDCGVFAIANATALALGKNPVGLLFDMTKSREHLVKCLKNRKMEHFPLILKNYLVLASRKRNKSHQAM